MKDADKKLLEEARLDIVCEEERFQEHEDGDEFSIHIETIEKLADRLQEVLSDNDEMKTSSLSEASKEMLIDAEKYRQKLALQGHAETAIEFEKLLRASGISIAQRNIAKLDLSQAKDKIKNYETNTETAIKLAKFLGKEHEDRLDILRAVHTNCSEQLCNRARELLDAALEDA